MGEHRREPRRAWIAGLALVLAGVWGVRAEAQSPPPPPTPPAPPAAPSGVLPDIGGFTVPAGTTHEGDVYKVTPAASIEGTLDGDLTCWASAVSIPGKVLGDVNAFAGAVDITGEVNDSVRIYAGAVTIDGKLHGELLVSGGDVVVGRSAEVDGRSKFFVKEVTIEGTLNGDTTITGGVAHIRGTIDGDAKITVDEVDFSPDARITGDLHYFARKPADLEGKGIVGGTIVYDAHAEREVRIERRHAERRAFGTRFFFFLVALLSGSVAIALFRTFLPPVTRAIEEPVQSLGAGFLAMLTPIAAAITLILIITIPLVVLYWLLFAVALYLAKVPVAVWIGRRILDRVRGKESSVYLALLVGLVILYLLFALPVLGKVVWVATALLGLGAIVLGVRDWRQARRATPPPTPAPPAPPAPSPAV